MKILVFAGLFVLLIPSLRSQPDSLSTPRPSILAPADTFSRPRFWVATGGLALGYSGVTVALDRAWYAGYPRSSFHFFDDNGEWNLMDKMGHFFTAYNQSRYTADLYKWTGMKRKPAAWVGFGAGMVFQGTIEVLDGFSSQWGASVGDVVANTAGSGLFLAQEMLWEEQRISIKYSFFPVKYGDQQIVSDQGRSITRDERASELFGSSLPERILKDYNAGTCWASFNIKSFMPNKETSRFPAWLNLAVGYSAQNMLSARPNGWIEDGQTFAPNGPDYPRFSQVFVSPDIDFTRIPVKKRGWKLLFKALNLIKAPLPGVEFRTDGKVRFNLLSF